ncbi:MAG: hypothetical protein MI867_01760, partial [Pseudomonadales bacterium]|nr:hypothetical protein [Pseudomonadales bacterium]
MDASSIRQVLLVLLMFGLVGCKNTYDIAEPAKDSVHTSPPTFKITYQEEPDALPPMTLNGHAIEAFFTAGTTEATANSNDFADFFVEGYNTFQVEPPTGPSTNFIYDTEGPAIIVLDAEISGNTATINGLADDVMGVTAATVNDIAITFNEDQRFTVDVPEAEIYTYEATDTLGHTSTTHYAALGNEYDPSMTVRVTTEALDVAMVEIARALNELDLNPLVANYMLYDDTWLGLFGETYGGDGFVRTVDILGSEFSMNFTDGGNANIEGTITNSRVEITLRLHNGFLPPTLINIGANVGPLDFSGDIELGVEDQSPTVELSNFDISVGNVAIDNTDVVTQAILSAIISGIANMHTGTIANGVENELNTAIPEMLAGIIQDSYMIRINDGVNNHDLAIAIKLSDLTTSDSSLYASLAGGVIPSTPNPEIPQPLAGTLYTEDPLPEANLNGGQFAISLNANLLNQTLASAHSVGLTQMNIVGDQIQFGLPRAADLGPEGASQRILVNIIAPAVIQIDNINDSAAATLSVYGLEIVSESKQEGDLEFSHDVSVRVNAKVPVSIDASTSASLGIVFPASPEADIMGIKIGEGDWLSDSINALAEQLVDQALANVMEQIAAPITHIELPSFACMALEVNGITAVGGESSHLNVAGSLIKISDECDIENPEPPKVAYGRGVGIPMSCASDQEYDAGLCYTQCAENYNGVGPVCWREEASYGRGVGTVPTGCGAGRELDAGLCYPVCRSGYHGVGPVCWSNQPLSYGRGAGTIPSNIWTGECPAGKENDAGLCYPYCNSGYTGVGPVCWLDQASYGRGVGTVPNDCGNGRELDAGLCYPVCNQGYHGVGPVCWTNDALSYGRGVGVPIHTCHDGMEQDAGLCYPVCNQGYHGVGPVCWTNDAL